jgi:hypothetical protein
MLLASVPFDSCDHQACTTVSGQSSPTNGGVHEERTNNVLMHCLRWLIHNLKVALIRICTAGMLPAGSQLLPAHF